MNRLLRRRARGFIMYFTVALITLLAVMSAIVYAQSESQRVMMGMVKRRMIAGSRARMGAELALAGIRDSAAVRAALSGLPSEASLKAARQSPDTNGDGMPDSLYLFNNGLPYQGPNGLSPDDGGGYLYKAEVYREAVGDSSNYVLIVTGYHGASTTDEPASSRLELKFTANFDEFTTTGNQNVSW